MRRRDLVPVAGKPLAVVVSHGFISAIHLHLVQNSALQADLAKKRISSMRDAQGYVNPAIVAPKVPPTPRLDLAQLGDSLLYLRA